MLSTLHQPPTGVILSSEFHEPGIWPQENMKELTFYRLNRRGKPLKISREKYLRDDLHCGSLACSTCIPSPSIKTTITLDANPPIKSNKFKEKHYLLPDAGFILRQLDVVEELDNVILLQLMMEQVFRYNATKYKRLREGYKTKKMSYFLNEHHRATYIERRPNETTEERNQRAFLTAYNYFQSHFAPVGIKVIILSDDPEFKQKYKANENVVVASGEEYVAGLIDEIRLDLEDKLCRIPFNEDESINKFAGATGGDFAYPPHLSLLEVQDGIKAGKFMQGSFRTFNFFEGFVRIDGDNNEAREILIQGLENVNRATDGDIVAIQILNQDQWSAPSGMVVIDDLADEPPLTPDKVLQEPEAEEQETKLLEQLHQKQKELNKDKELRKTTGRVIGIIRRKWSPVCGIIRESINPNSSTHFFLPDNKKLPRVKIETRNVSRFSGQKILVQIDSWPPSSRYPVGHYLKVLGKAGDLETETSAVLHEHGVPHGPFSAAVEACLPSLPYIIHDNEVSARCDFRDLTIVSVDPPGCTDIDDALHCIHLPDGNYQVGVHIADVSHFIEPGTALDAEAAKRGTSVYLADRRIDMIPPLLSSNLCSLHCNTDKLVFSVVWKLSPDAQILSTKYTKGIIRSKAALTYAEAQAKLNSNGTDEITRGLKGLSTLAQILKKRRFENGALMLSSAEVRDDGSMTNSEESEEESHSMVEEFMLLANCSVAQFILQHYREFSLLRRHPSPPPANFDPLLLAAKAHGINVVVDNGSKALNESIENCPAELRGILRVLTTRCMTQALYYCSGTTSPSEYSHFGLAVGLYTHFTSPIRRYADLMVHRLLAMAIGVLDPDPRILVSKQMHSICENINTRHRMAQYASRASYNYHKSRMLLGKQEKEFGYIMFIRRNALQIFVPNYGIEGFIFFPKDTSLFVYNEKEGNVVFGKTKLYALDKVKVELSLEEEKNKVIFKLIEPKIAGLND